MASRLKEKYQKEIIPELQKKFGYKNRLACPGVEKVILNMGVGSAAQNPKELEGAINDLMLISGQKPVPTLSKKAISAFKIRKGHKIGIKVTLRDEQMYEFLDKLFNIVLPRVRDFKGTSDQSFDGLGNYSLGLREQSIFPEIDYSKLDKIRSFEITIVTSTQKDNEAYELLKLLGMPFRKKINQKDGG